MKLKAKKYTMLNLLPTLISIAPGGMIASLLANALIGILPILNALATAWFIDSALSVAAGTKTMMDMILPILTALLMQLADYSRWELDNYGCQCVKRGLLSYYTPAVAAKVAALEYRCIEDGETWDLIHRMSENPHDQLFSVLDGVIYLFQLMLSVGSVIVLVGAQVWWAAALIVLCMIPILVISMKMGDRAYAIRTEEQPYHRRLGYLENVGLSRDFSEERALFGYGRKIVEKYEGQYENAWGRTRRYWKMEGINGGFMIGTFTVVMAVTILILLKPAVGGALGVGMLVAIVREIISMNGRIPGLSYCMRQVGKGKAFVNDLTKFSNLPEKEGALDDPIDPPMTFETLEFKNVTFAYPGTGRNILENFSLRLERGKHYAFVGVNGAGKTTMTKLITGLYHEYTGEILLNGRDIRTYSQAQLKSLCAPVFQDFARYEVPMKDSIALGFERREQRIGEISKAVGLDEAISNLSRGLDTPLGKTYEGGQDLSGGQWQRLAIARALVSDAPLRILDEPTAALDPISESQFYEQFGALSKGVTTLFISHRLGSTRLADRIFVLDGGRIAEEGTQAELLKLNGLYAQMFEAQRSWYQ